MDAEPAVDHAVIEFKTALPEHRLQISIAQRITQASTDCAPNQPCLEVSAFEALLRVVLQLFGNGIHNTGSLPYLGSRISPALVTSQLTKKICDKALGQGHPNKLIAAPKQQHQGASHTSAGDPCTPSGLWL